MYLYFVAVKGNVILFFSGSCPRLKNSRQGYPAAVLQPHRMGCVCRLYLGGVCTIVVYSSGTKSYQNEYKINFSVITYPITYGIRNDRKNSVITYDFIFLDEVENT